VPSPSIECTGNKQGHVLDIISRLLWEYVASDWHRFTFVMELCSLRLHVTQGSAHEQSCLKDRFLRRFTLRMSQGGYFVCEVLSHASATLSHASATLSHESATLSHASATLSHASATLRSVEPCISNTAASTNQYLSSLQPGKLLFCCVQAMHIPQCVLAWRYIKQHSKNNPPHPTFYVLHFYIDGVST